MCLDFLSLVGLDVYVVCGTRVCEPCQLSSEEDKTYVLLGWLCRFVEKCLHNCDIYYLTLNNLLCQRMEYKLR